MATLQVSRNVRTATPPIQCPPWIHQAASARGIAAKHPWASPHSWEVLWGTPRPEALELPEGLPRWQVRKAEHACPGYRLVPALFEIETGERVEAELLTGGRFGDRWKLADGTKLPDNRVGLKTKLRERGLVVLGHWEPVGG